jgi:hypothetical protein
MTITPTALIQVDRLSLDLGHGCPNWVDATGRTFNIDKVDSLPRRANPKWQRDVREYLLSGGAVILVGDAGNLNAVTVRAIRREHLLVQIDTIALYETRHRTRP